MSWTAKSSLDPSSRATLERAVNALPPDWLHPPQTGDVFNSIIDYEKRLRGFALAEGFDIVRLRGSNPGRPASTEFGCIHHGSQTRNYRQLEDRVVKDDAGVIISERQRQNTSVYQQDCP